MIYAVNPQGAPSCEHNTYTCRRDIVASVAPWWFSNSWGSKCVNLKLCALDTRPLILRWNREMGKYTVINFPFIACNIENLNVWSAALCLIKLPFNLWYFIGAEPESELLLIFFSCFRLKQLLVLLNTVWSKFHVASVLHVIDITNEFVISCYVYGGMYVFITCVYLHLRACKFRTEILCRLCRLFQRRSKLAASSNQSF
jgi:hypothetical protein